MPDFGRAAPDQPALEKVVRTDRLVDALAERLPVEFDDPGDEALAALLEDWRDELRWPPASALVAEDDAVEAVRNGVAARQRARRGFAVVGSVAASVLFLSGFGVLVVDAKPGNPLYGLHTMMFDAPRRNDDQVVLSAKAELAQVQEMIAQGQWDQAQDKLAAVNSTVQTVNDGDRKQNLIDEVNLLNTKVASRDPNATLPGSAPTAEANLPTSPPGASMPQAPASGPSTAPSPSSSVVVNTTTPPSPVATSTTTPSAASPTTTSSPPTTTAPSEAAASPAPAATSAQAPSVTTTPATSTQGRSATGGPPATPDGSTAQTTAEAPAMTSAANSAPQNPNELGRS